jgi:diphthamide biosynthesis methyltransferase
MVVLCSDMGTDDQSISYLSVEDLAEAKTGRLHCLVIPAEPSDVEADALSRWSKK